MGCAKVAISKNKTLATASMCFCPINNYPEGAESASAKRSNTPASTPSPEEIVEELGNSPIAVQNDFMDETEIPFQEFQKMPGAYLDEEDSFNVLAFFKRVSPQSIAVTTPSVIEERTAEDINFTNHQKSIACIRRALIKMRASFFENPIPRSTATPEALGQITSRLYELLNDYGRDPLAIQREILQKKGFNIPEKARLKAEKEKFTREISLAGDMEDSWYLGKNIGL